MDPYVFQPSGSVIICADPDPDPDPDPSIKKQKKIRKTLVFWDYFMAFYLRELMYMYDNDTFKLQIVRTVVSK